MPEQFHIKIKGGEIRIWEVTETEQELINQINLTPDEFIRVKNMKNESARLSFLTIRNMHKKSGFGRIQYNENGKPFCSGGFISISHSGHINTILHHTLGEQGIDIEKIQPRILKIKSRFLGEEEELICENNLVKYTLCWSAKEAVFKKFGKETVYFRENQKILEIDENNKQIIMKITAYKKQTIVHLGYFYPNKDYVLVYTL